MPTNKKNLEQLFDNWLIPIALFVVLIAGIAYMVKISIPKSVEHRADTIEQTPISRKETKTFFYDNLKTVASSIYVFDVKEGKVLFEKNAYEKKPLASITKLMTALVADELLPKNTIITINEEALAAEGDSGLKLGDRWDISNLIDFSLIASSNDASRAISLAVGPSFIDQMNGKARKIGLERTAFANETGLDIDEKRGGAYGSARDVALLVEYLLLNYPHLLEATRFESLDVSSVDNSQVRAVNTNRVTSEIPNLIGSKTGFTDLSGGNLAVIFDADLGRPIIIVVLGSTFEGRFTDVVEISKATLHTLSEE